MANIGVSQSPPPHHGSMHSSSRRRQHSNATANFDLFSEDLFTHPGGASANDTNRKRHNSSSGNNDVHMDSPSHKRSRLLWQPYGVAKATEKKDCLNYLERY